MKFSKIGDHVVYPNPFFHALPAHRWWIDQKILVGGSILSAADFEHLRVDYGVTHVLSVESERSDWGKVPLDSLRYLPTADDGTPQPARILQDAAAFGRAVIDGGGVLHVHCQMGASRSPTYSYAVLRATYGIDRDEFLRRIRTYMPTWGSHQFHPAYMTSVEDAIPLDRQERAA